MLLGDLVRETLQQGRFASALRVDRVNGHLEYPARLQVVDVEEDVSGFGPGVAHVRPELSGDLVVDLELEVLALSAVEAGRALDRQRLRRLVRERAVVRRLGLTCGIMKYLSLSGDINVCRGEP